MAATDEMKVKAVAPWFGGKRTMAPDIVAELGKHTQYFEPFCGSMAVLLEKPESRQETVNDLHGDLTNLARVLADDSLAVALYDRTSRVLVSDGLLADAASRLKEPFQAETPSLDRAFWYFVQSWCMRNGTAGTNIGQPRGIGTQLAVRYTANGGSPTVRFRNSVESIPAWHSRLRNVVVLTRDAFAVIPKIEDSSGTAIYVDPPYVAETRAGFAGSGAQSRYLHEFRHATTGGLFPGDDHSRLRDLLAGFQKARIVISYYDCPRVRELYAGWTFVDHSRQKHLHNMGGRGERKETALEVLIINGPSYAQ